MMPLLPRLEADQWNMSYHSCEQQPQNSVSTPQLSRSASSAMHNKEHRKAKGRAKPLPMQRQQQRKADQITTPDHRLHSQTANRQSKNKQRVHLHVLLLPAAVQLGGVKAVVKGGIHIRGKARGVIAVVLAVAVVAVPTSSEAKGVRKVCVTLARGHAQHAVHAQEQAHAAPRAQRTSEPRRPKGTTGRPPRAKPMCGGKGPGVASTAVRGGRTGQSLQIRKQGLVDHGRASDAVVVRVALRPVASTRLKSSGAAKQPSDPAHALQHAPSGTPRAST